MWVAKFNMFFPPNPKSIIASKLKQVPNSSKWKTIELLNFSSTSTTNPTHLKSLTSCAMRLPMPSQFCFQQLMIKVYDYLNPYQFALQYPPPTPTPPLFLLFHLLLFKLCWTLQSYKHDIGQHNKEIPK